MSTLLALSSRLPKARGRSEPNTHGLMHFLTSPVGLPHAWKYGLAGAVLVLALAPAPVLPQAAGDGVAARDIDGDGVPNRSDNCPTVANPAQADTFGSLGVGDACEAPPNPDSDSDGIANLRDNCAAHFNPKQTDSDGDSQGDACDTQLTTQQTEVTCGGQTATIVGTPRNDRIPGTPNPDVIHGLGGDDLVFGRGGNDTICGGAGTGDLRGDAGRNRLFGGAGGDRLSDGDGDDRLSGGDGGDILSDDAGADANQLFGDASSDLLNCRDGDTNDTCHGGAGTDSGTADPGDERISIP